MLRTRVIPLVLLDGYSVVKTINFDVRRNLGNPVVVCRIYNNRNVDELILLDIDASKQNRGIDLNTVEQVAAHCFMPLCVGGGLHSIESIAKTLEAGADKVCLNTVFFEDIDFIKEAVATFGSQCIVGSIDVSKNDAGEYQVYSHSNKKADMTLDECLDAFNDSGVGEMLINNVDLDGMMKGYDCDLVSYVSQKVKNIPLIMAGGASSAEDCAEVIKAGASAACAASIFHFTNITPERCKEAMNKEGIPVRLIAQ